jgi:Fe-S cluster assembly ATP-binding protein
MDQPIINVQNISKKFVLSHQQLPYETLRDKMTELAKKPFEVLRGRKIKTTKEDFWALKDINFSVQRGEVIGIIGPNGSGKSTLANTLMGHPAYTITAGTITLDGTDCATLSPDKRARLGLFLSQQYPPEINGVSMSQFLRLAKNTLSKTTHNPLEFTKKIQAALTDVGLSTDFAGRSVNTSFSGGEKNVPKLLNCFYSIPPTPFLMKLTPGLMLMA